MRITTLLGLTLDLEADDKLERFYDQILACPTGEEAETLAYGPENPLAEDVAPGALPVWTAAQLRDPRWAYLQDAVARCRAAAGELDLASVMRAATWDVAEAARSLGVVENSVRVLVRNGDLPAVQAGGRYLLDRRAVEAYAAQGTRQGTAAGAPVRVPALYIRAGRRHEATLTVIVTDAAGQAVDGELLTDVDGAEEAVIPSWAEAVIAWGTAGKLRAVRVRPAHGRAVSRFGVAGLEVVGRVELLDRTNNRAEAADMLTAERKRVGRA